MKDTISRVLLLLGLVTVIFSIGFFFYSKANEKAVGDSEKVLAEVRKKNDELRKVEEELEKELKTIEGDYGKKSEEFREAFHVSYEELEAHGISDDIEVYEREQKNILGEMKKILDETGYAFTGSAYDDDDVVEAAARYSEMFSKSEWEKRPDDLFTAFQIRDNAGKIMKDGTFAQGFPKDLPESRKQALAFHLFTLSQPLYRAAHGDHRIQNPEELLLDYTLYVRRWESLAENIAIGIDLEPLVAGQKKMEDLFYRYREYDGVLFQLKELNKEAGNEK